MCSALEPLEKLSRFLGEDHQLVLLYLSQESLGMMVQSLWKALGQENRRLVLMAQV